MMPLPILLSFGAILFCIGVAGILLNRRSLISFLIAIELILLAVNTNLIAFSRYLHEVSGEVFVFFILTVAAVESVIGLAILVVLYRSKRTIQVDQVSDLKG